MSRGSDTLVPADAKLEPVRLADGRLMAQRDAPVGGQAVLEGVMMRGVGTWAVAVRKPLAEQTADGELDLLQTPRGEIAVQSFPLDSWLRRQRVYRLPLVRGVVALGESLAIGFRALGIAANAQLGEDEAQIGGGLWAGTIVVALVLAIGLFFLLPVGVTSLFKHQLGSSWAFWLVEGLLRTTIFLGYLVLLSRVRDLRRVFEYHGAEHKTIACYEAGEELVPANAERYSRLHPRCGTSFLLIVMIVAIFVFAPIGLPAWYWLMATRILGVPLIAGISFEAIKFAGRNRGRRWVRALMWPGLQLQRLTTREPDRDQLAVAIAALDAVLAVETPGEQRAQDLVGLEVVA
ncbi:MAG: DUF1385 domain-containing protein [Solirubrobacterales bacterium]|nr:MAG: DUF1385 domain-containing protein [Solirubrobacterales bacterium]